MSEDTGQQQRYCTNCGAEVRAGNAFCFTCGAPLTTGAQEPDPTHPEPTPSEEPNPFDRLMTWLRQAADRLGGSFSGLSTDGVRRLPARAIGWFRDLPSIPKVVIAGLVLLVLLIPLSPVAAIICALLLGVSIIALIIRVVQRRSVKNWGIVAVTSVVLMFTFDRISDALLLLVIGLVMAALPVVYLVLGGPQRIREKVSFLTALLTDPSDPRVVKYRQEKANGQERINRQRTALRHRRQQTNYMGTGKAPGLGTPDSSSAPRQGRESLRAWWRQASTKQRSVVMVLAGVMLWFAVLPLLQGGIAAVRSSSYTVTSEKSYHNQPGTAAVIEAETESDDLETVAKTIVRDYRDDGYDAVDIFLSSNTSDHDLIIRASYSSVGEAQIGIPAGRYEVSRGG